MNKDAFFYSNFCEHCKDVMNIITKNNIRDHFMFVSVDNKKFKIPGCVTHVPTIITKQNDVLMDANVITYIERIVHSMIEDVSPYSLGAQSGYSSSYTWLTENGYDNDGRVSLQNESVGKNNYVMIGTDSRMMTPQQTDTSKGSKFDDSMYEKYVNSRNADDEFMKRQVQPSR
jgi:hypothetical protein